MSERLSASAGSDKAGCSKSLGLEILAGSERRSGLHQNDVRSHDGLGHSPGKKPSHSAASTPDSHNAKTISQDKKWL